MNVKISHDKLEGINLLGVDWFRKAMVDLSLIYDAQKPNRK